MFELNFSIYTCSLTDIISSYYWISRKNDKAIEIMIKTQMLL